MKNSLLYTYRTVRISQLAVVAVRKNRITGTVSVFQQNVAESGNTWHKAPLGYGRWEKL